MKKIYYKAMYFCSKYLSPWGLKNRLINRYDRVETGLDKWNFHDSDNVILYANMNILTNFVEKECADEKFFQDESIEHYFSDEELKEMAESIGEEEDKYQEIRNIYLWWKNYDVRLEEINKAVMDESKPDGERYNYYFKLEETLREEENTMLIRLVNVRHYLWT